MKLKALSHYNNDLDTRFGDCILLYDSKRLIVYDCGHEKHAQAVVDFLKRHSTINYVNVVVSHNDSDHTDGVVTLFDYLYINRSNYTTKLYSSLYLKDVKEVLELLDDDRRNPDSTKQNILKIFDKIKLIVEKAQEYNFSVINAEIGTSIESATIVGPKKDEFVNVVAQAIKDGNTTKIEGETVMNAASIQIKCKLNNGQIVLLCGDASPSYIHKPDNYDIIQLPHHGQLADAEIIFEKLDNAGNKLFLVSDNTGSGEKSGGSDNLEKSHDRKAKRIKNTKNGIVELPEVSIYEGGDSITASGIIIPSNQKTGGYGCDIL
ncbi:MAG: hypothetical protein LBM93_14175 [Oscillospiraceae bacterium]|jgi:hypothetical protein|nr:hypothetical protein [Oscillospiraceae bacterium]